MTQTEPKTKVGKFLKNILKPLVRGAIKSIPVIGTPIAEILTNVTQPIGEPKKHTNISIIIQVTIAAAVLLDLILNKGENVKAILELFGLIGGSA
ncbi:MAG: hypothetical protein A2Z57_11190 [Planctomycetes bacterium RIFCSPHIGHO2_12_39_6]|nr:MAG: hypothetical protein A2Z57_11190 [Planctomycetes bacterium RIFCSPHIGHO2_12_39_6]